MSRTSPPAGALPDFLYGTAWKEEETERLTRLALGHGFRGIDTANQRRHYDEAAVGAAVAGAILDGVVRREELFLQTKFTYVRGQDHRLPYEREAAPGEQVRQSFASSLAHLQVEAVDAFLLHGPSRREGLGAVDLEVWKAMEALHAAGSTRLLGVSNVGLDQLELLWKRAAVRPALVQNRCYARLGWDRDVRLFCRDHGIVYQGFSLLTANAAEISHPEIQRLARRLGVTVAQVVFRFAQQVGMLPLTGTSDPEHMREDLASRDLTLAPRELALVESIAG